MEWMDEWIFYPQNEILSGDKAHSQLGLINHITMNMYSEAEVQFQVRLHTPVIFPAGLQARYCE
jgi:hypothetical protein